MVVNKSLGMGLLALVAVSISSCSVATVNSRTQTNATANTQYINTTPIVQIPKLAYLNVDTKKKISGRADEKGTNVELVKELAVYNALNNSGADVLVEPAFKITTTSTGYNETSISVEVSGYSGKYTEIRNITKEDSVTIDNIKIYNSLFFAPTTGSNGGHSGTTPAPTNSNIRMNLWNIKN